MLAAAGVAAAVAAAGRSDEQAECRGPRPPYLPYTANSVLAFDFLDH